MFLPVAGITPGAAKTPQDRRSTSLLPQAAVAPAPSDAAYHVAHLARRSAPPQQRPAKLMPRKMPPKPCWLFVTVRSTPVAHESKLDFLQADSQEILPGRDLVAVQAGRLGQPAVSDMDGQHQGRIYPEFA